MQESDDIEDIFHPDAAWQSEIDRDVVKAQLRDAEERFTAANGRHAATNDELVDWIWVHGGFKSAEELGYPDYDE